MLGRSKRQEKPVGRHGKYSDEFRTMSSYKPDTPHEMKEPESTSGPNELNDESGSAAFRRGTTLSTFHSETRERSERQHEHDLRLRRRRLGVVLLSLAFLVVLGLLILSQFSGQVNSVTSNAPSLPTDRAQHYKSLIDKYFASNPFERFSFGRRDQALSEFVIASAPEIKELKISSAGLMEGKLNLTFRRPVAMWDVNGATSYVDDSGVVFQYDYFDQPGVTITDDSGVTPIDGVAASARFLSFIGQTTAHLAKDSNETVERVVIPRGAVRYVEFYLTGRSYPFKAQIDRDPSSQSADITAMARYLDANHISPQYVDVRVAGKGYWK